MTWGVGPSFPPPPWEGECPVCKRWVQSTSHSSTENSLNGCDRADCYFLPEEADYPSAVTVEEAVKPSAPAKRIKKPKRR